MDTVLAVQIEDEFVGEGQLVCSRLPRTKVITWKLY